MWNLIVFEKNDAYPTTHSNREGTIESFKDLVYLLVPNELDGPAVWALLTRDGAHYAEWDDATYILVNRQ